MSMSRTLLASLVAGGLALAGCGDKPSGESSAKTEKKAEAPKVEAKPIETLFTGTAPALPAPYKGLKPGMTADEAKAIFPAMPEDDTVKVPEYPDVRFNVDFDKKTKKIKRFYFDLPKDKAEAALTKAWGAPTQGETTIKKPISYWFNGETGLRATLEEGFGGDMKVELSAYTPAEKFLGAEGTAFAFEAKQAILGATIEDLRKGYATELVEKSQADADADRKKMEAMMGAENKQKLAALGGPKPSAYLDFPPTEFGSYWTRVNLTFDDAGKVSRFRTSLDYRAHPAAKDPLFALLKKKLGEPKEEEKYGKKLFVFGDKPRVEVEEDTISHAWDIEIEAPAP